MNNVTKDSIDKIMISFKHIDKQSLWSKLPDSFRQEIINEHNKKYMPWKEIKTLQLFWSRLPECLQHLIREFDGYFKEKMDRIIKDLYTCRERWESPNRVGYYFYSTLALGFISLNDYIEMHSWDGWNKYELYKYIQKEPKKHYPKHQQKRIIPKHTKRPHVFKY